MTAFTVLLTFIELQGKRRSHHNCDSLGLGEWGRSGVGSLQCSMPRRRSSQSPIQYRNHDACKLGCGFKNGGVDTRQL